MEIFNTIMTIVLSVAAAILLILLIALVIKLFKTLNKVDKVVDDINYKSSKLNGVFNLIDSTTSAIEAVNDKIVSSFVKGVSGIFNKKKGGKKDE